MMFNQDSVKYLRCPQTGDSLLLSEDGTYLYTQSGAWRYPIENGIALLLAEYGQAFTEDKRQ